MHGLKGVRADEVGGVPGVEVVGIVTAEEVDVALDEVVNLVFVSDADAGRDFVECGLVCARPSFRTWSARGMEHVRRSTLTAQSFRMS